MAVVLVVASCQSVPPPPSATPGLIASPTPPAPKVTPNPPVIVDGWAFRVPFPLPEGAIPLELSVEPIPERFSIPEGASFGCHQAGIRFTLEYDANAPPPLGLADDPVWPYGYSARLYKGRAEVVSPAGHVTMRDGETKAFSGGLSTDDKFHICMQSLLPKLVESPGPS